MTQETIRSFASYKTDGHNWITLANGEFYPDILTDAVLLYEPVLVMFGQLLKVQNHQQNYCSILQMFPNSGCELN